MITNFKGQHRVLKGNFVRAVAYILALVITFAGTAFAAAAEPYTVDIYDGSHVLRVETAKLSADEILAEAEIIVSGEDKLILTDFNPGTQSRIIICRAASVYFTDAEGVRTEHRFAGRVGEFLQSLGITLDENTAVNVNAESICIENMEIILTTAKKVTVSADGEIKEITTMAQNVGDLLSETGITLGEFDETEPTADTQITEGLSVKVLRVEYATRETEEKVAFTTKTEYTASMQKGVKKVTQKGADGRKTVVYKDKVVNGEVVATTVDSESEILAPVPQIVAVGTYAGGNTQVIKNAAPISELKMPSKYSVGANGVPTSYKYTIHGKAAAYCIPGGTTSTGKKVKPGYIAVNPKQIPYGTEMYIVSDDGVVYGYAIAADTGGFAKQGKFVVDLYMNSTSQCYQWGSRNVTIYVL